jgi:hypothetical protein
MAARRPHSLSPLIAARTSQASRPRDFGTWALAAQLSVRAVSQTIVRMTVTTTFSATIVNDGERGSREKSATISEGCHGLERYDLVE